MATDVLGFAATLLFVMDPLGNIPLFHTVLQRVPDKRRWRVILRELLIALIILMAFLWAGEAFLGFLGLEQPTLNIAGGILLFLIAMRMIFPDASKKVADDDMDETPFIVPLAMPMVAGPSTIALLLLQASADPTRMLEWSAALLMAWGVATLILVSSSFFVKRLGRRGLRALERLMGMLLILIAVQMFMNGVTVYLETIIN